jgi:NAD-dependent deacetylase
MSRVGAAELMVEFLGKSLRGEVGSANTHGRQHRTPGLARRGTFAKLAGMAVDREIAELARAIARARRAVVFTGAGISTESGIPDFRSPGGIWTRMAPIDFSDFLASEEARRETWRRRFAMEDTFRTAAPNRGHRAVAELVRRGTVARVITQNIDGLHQASGIPDERVIELHGNTTYARCLDCQTRYELDALRIVFERSGTPPSCDDCGGFVKTAAISFGQAMPAEAMRRAEIETRAADLFIVAGSSLVVYPAAAFPELAKHNGATLVIINREPTGLDAIADLVLNRAIGDTLGTAIGVD